MNIPAASATPTVNPSVPSLPALLLQHAADRPDAPAIVQGNRTMSYAALADLAQKLATRLSNLGVETGDRIVLHLGNSEAAVIGAYASMMLGAIAVPLNIHLKANELGRLLRRLAPAVYVGHDAQRKLMDDMAAGWIPLDRRFYVDDTPHTPRHAGRVSDAADTWQALIASARELRSFPPADPDAPTALVCTSGTMGDPKLVVHTQRTFTHMVEAAQAGGFSRESRPLAPTPLFHMPGFHNLCNAISSGACIALPTCLDFDGAAFLDAIEQHRCTSVTVTPYGATEMIRAQVLRRRTIDSVRSCVVAGDASSVELRQRFEQTFGIPLIARLGMTEAPFCVAQGSSPHAMCARPGTARIIDSHDNDVPAGVPGELCLKLNTLFAGYWISPDVIDPARDADGWYRTGDFVREDEQGDLIYIARIKDIIVRDGENISPAEIGQTLLMHPAVTDAAVVGIPDEVLGERIVGVVRLAEQARDTRPDEMIAWLATQLADHKLPEAVLFVEQIPRTVFGKPDRRALRELASAKLAPPR
ncbi:class I adenylate-forming enzyme family protein [Paraburkholderia solisilvae]|uniref:Long-chain-fatty-acid--CoA ligase n=1 Tax=Paraburkholderia solisilvae TaxID=624376 RepID=A0A6J5DL48_9BURK|nr:class I adenylate-forming enzyme family protein [Paraburkholderia solisilvae]CAB3754703.1 Long-chain-fatty-acid--CoA ligase [Paraburkholderia solisilvae]